jgi:hypothetical protein
MKPVRIILIGIAVFVTLHLLSTSTVRETAGKTVKAGMVR